MRASVSKSERQRRYRSGKMAEWAASALLIAKGYRIVSRRFSCPAGEIDLIAVRGRRVAFVEVKRRATLDAAHASITPHQRQRIGEAADWWLARNPRFQAFNIGFDLVFIVRRHWPRHLENAL